MIIEENFSWLLEMILNLPFLLRTKTAFHGKGSKTRGFVNVRHNTKLKKTYKIAYSGKAYFFWKKYNSFNVIN